MQRKNLYLVLDLTPQCSQNEILHAYNRAKSTYSRDSLAAYSLYDDNAKESILREIEDAYHILGDPRKRKVYDIQTGLIQDISPEEQKKILAELEEKLKLPGDTVPKFSQSSKKKIEITPQIRIEANPEFEKEIQEKQSLSGSFIRAVRLYRGYAETQLATLCQLKIDHILAIEEERPLNLHHPVYLRGHLILICDALQIPNANKLAKSYIERLQQEEKIANTKSL